MVSSVIKLIMATIRLDDRMVVLNHMAKILKAGICNQDKKFKKRNKKRSTTDLQVWNKCRKNF